MRKRSWIVAILAALTLPLAYRIYISDQPVTLESWYQGQDITEGEGPMPFNAVPVAAAGRPEQDEAGDLPSDIYRVYIDAAAAGRFDKGLLSDASQGLFLTRQPSAEQLRNSVVGYRECRGGEELASYDLAVLRYPPDERLCPPILFRRESGVWRLDFMTMHDAIGHNHRNYWHFNRGKPPADYAFAFTGWRFDKGGFPLIP